MAFAELQDKNKVWELLSMINPINHAKNPKDAEKYKSEPYVMAADVYASPQHKGRGGWTWYTGSAGWMYQLIIESFLGLKRDGNILRIEPCVPDEWKSFAVRYCFEETVYHIRISRKANESNKTIINVDGNIQNENIIPLVNDKAEHSVEVILHVEEAAQKMINEKVG